MVNTTEATVRGYYRVVGDLSCTEEELREIVQPDAVFIEHPNPIVPRGAERSPEQMLAGFRAGRALLSDQQMEILDVIVDGDRAAVRATWRGVVGADRGPFTAGTELTCVMGGFVTVREGKVARHETYDCYPPLPVALPA